MAADACSGAVKLPVVHLLVVSAGWVVCGAPGRWTEVSWC